MLWLIYHLLKRKKTKKDLAFMLRLNLHNLKKVKIMSKDTGGKESRNWSISVGFYPGILLGMRTYNEEDQNVHVLYLPFVDLALEIYL
tara:strand:+ start:748 stop:1011 length:264 start_codon:yes stop_codon:yes gene_type:complete